MVARARSTPSSASEPADEAVEAALATIPAGELEAALRVARPRARGGRRSPSCAAAWPIARSAPSRPRRRSGTAPPPGGGRRARGRRGARGHRRPCGRPRAAPSTGSRQAGVDRPRRAGAAAGAPGRARRGVGVRGRRHRRPRPLADARGTLRGAHAPGGDALGRVVGLLDFSAGAHRQEAGRGAARAPCARRARCPGWRSRRAGPGRPSCAAAGAARRGAPRARGARRAGSSASGPRRPSPPRSTRGSRPTATRDPPPRALRGAARAPELAGWFLDPAERHERGRSSASRRRRAGSS